MKNFSTAIALLLTACSTVPALIPADPDQIDYNIKSGMVTRAEVVKKLTSDGYMIKPAGRAEGPLIFEPHAYQIDRGSVAPPTAAAAEIEIDFAVDKIHVHIAHRCHYVPKYAKEAVDPAGIPCRPDDANFQQAKINQTNRLRSDIRRIPGVLEENYVHGAPTAADAQGNHVEPNTKAVGEK